MRALPFFFAFAALACAAGCGGSDAGSDELMDTQLTAWDPGAPRDGNLRVGTFNIRNFPHVPVEEQTAGAAPPLSYRLETDEDALVDILETLRFDVLAVEEIRDRDAFAVLVARLSKVTGRAYETQLSANVGGNDQLVGFVWDTKKVKIAWTREHEEIDISGTLRPGLSARFESVRAGGIDFTAMVLHLASGDSPKRATLRAQQAALAAKVVAAETAEVGDDDYVVLGDLNTAREAKEFAGLDGAFASGTELAREDNPLHCSAYWIKKSSNPLVRPSWLDQVYRASLDELDVPPTAGAHCAEHKCQQFESKSPESGRSFYSVSDHCPVYFELRDADDD